MGAERATVLFLMPPDRKQRRAFACTCTDSLRPVQSRLRIEKNIEDNSLASKQKVAWLFWELSTGTSKLQYPTHTTKV